MYIQLILKTFKIVILKKNIDFPIILFKFNFLTIFMIIK